MQRPDDQLHGLADSRRVFQSLDKRRCEFGVSLEFRKRR